MNEFLHSKRLYMLFLLPFIVVAIAFISTNFPVAELHSISIRGLINITYINELDKLWISVIGSVLLLAIAYMIFFISEKFKVYPQTTTLPALIYIFLTSGITVNMGFDYLLIAVLVVALAVAKLQMAITMSKTNQTLYDFGFLISLSVAIYPKFIFLLLWAFCVILFSGRSTLKDIMALLLGVITPLLFIASYYFWTDSLEQLPNIFMTNLWVGEYMHKLPLIELIRLGVLLLLLLLSLLQLSRRYSLMIVNRRRGVLSLVSMLMFLSLTLFAIPGNYYDFMYIIAFPLSFIYAQYFIYNHNSLVNTLMFIFLLFACFLTYLI